MTACFYLIGHFLSSLIGLEGCFHLVVLQWKVAGKFRVVYFNIVAWRHFLDEKNVAPQGRGQEEKQCEKSEGSG